MLGTAGIGHFSPGPITLCYANYNMEYIKEDSTQILKAAKSTSALKGAL